MTTEDETEEAPVPTKGGSKITLIAVAVNVVLTGVVAAKVLTLPDPVASKATELVATKVAAQPGPVHSLEPGPIHSLEPLTVNLNEPAGARYLRLTVELEMIDDAAEAKIAKMDNIIRDDLLNYLSGLTSRDTQGECARVQIQKQIATRVNGLMEGELIKRVMFADFVVQ